MANLADVRRPFDAVLKQIAAAKSGAAEGDPAIVEELKVLGRRIITDASNTKATKNITGNQLDAYGFGVYYNGKLVASGYLSNKYRLEHVSKKTGEMAVGAPVGDRGKWGRKEAFDAIKNYVPESKGYVLYITNAMYYSAAHEAHKLPIISQELGRAISELQEKYKVKFSDVQLYPWY